MARGRRHLTPFSLSFLDIMSCGFGAVVLLFLIIKHNVDTRVPVTVDEALSSEVMLLEEEIAEGREGLALLRNTLADTDERLVIAQGLARRIMEQIAETEGELESLTAGSDSAAIEKLKQRLKDLDEQKRKLQTESPHTGTAARKFIGQGERQYLTGLKLGGRRVLILLDSSASMMDSTLVNIIRRKHMSDTIKRRSEKWRRALTIVDWLTARLPIDSQYQIYTFSSEAKPALPETESRWLAVSDLVNLNQAMEGIRRLVPDGGTSLESAMQAVNRMQPAPDNIFLITDGLPTLGAKASGKNKVSSRERQQLFAAAIKRLPDGIPVNVILLPLEGDFMAPYEYWRLAVISQGSFLTPAKDWP